MTASRALRDTKVDNGVSGSFTHVKESVVLGKRIPSMHHVSIT